MAYLGQRVFGLDLLRALAILFVVYAHGYYVLDNAIPETVYNLPVLDGVTVFFVLSGFLIGRILLRTLTHPAFDVWMLLEFWLRRWFRTLPNYFLVLTLLVLLYKWHQQALPETTYLYFLFAQNIYTNHPAFFPEAWSLSIEEWFYLATPLPLVLSCWLWSRQPRQQIAVYWIIGVIVAVTLFRGYRIMSLPHLTPELWDLSLRKQVLTRIDSLMFGVLGAYSSLYWPSWQRYAKACAVLGISLLLLDKWFITHMTHHPIYVLYMQYGIFTLNAIGVLLLLPGCAQWQQAPRWLNNLISQISLLAYALYLLNDTLVQHFMLPFTLALLNKFWINSSNLVWLRYGLYWLLTVSSATLLYYGFERPITALRERWHLSRKPALSVFDANVR